MRSLMGFVMGSAFRNASRPEIFVVDAEPIIHITLAAAFKPDGLRVVSFFDGGSFLAVANAPPPACVLLDVDMADGTGMQILQKIDAWLYPAPILVMSTRHDVNTIVGAIKRGVLDFIEKPFDADKVVQRVHQTIERFRRHLPGCEPLTPREQQVLSHIARGAFNREMSRALGISGRTIEVHRAHIMRKLHARNAADLVRIALGGSIWNSGPISPQMAGAKALTR